MKHSYLLAGIMLSQFLKLISPNGLSLHQKNQYALTAKEQNLIGKELSDDLGKTGYKKSY